MRKVVWHPKALSAMKAFPDEVKRELGYLIYRLQQGVTLDLPHSRPMKSVATGVSELRVRGADGIYRAFYFLKSERGILVFHAFKKKTQQTQDKEIAQGSKNLKELLDG